MAARKKNGRSDAEEEAELSAAARYLYPGGASDPRQLTMVTRTKPHMVMAMVRLRLVSEALNPNRTQSLLDVFIEEYDRRMIAINGEGRKEFIDMTKQEKEEGEELHL